MPVLSPIAWGVCGGAVFAAFWGLWGAFALPNPWRKRVAVPVLMASAGLIARAAVGGGGLAGAAPRFDPGALGAALIGASILLVLVLSLMRSPRLRGYRPPAASLVVGVLFAVLWAETGLRLCLGVALGLAAAGLIACGWPRRPGGLDPRLAVTGLGSALVLWAACLSSLG
jgi:hypothetical protein